MAVDEEAHAFSCLFTCLSFLLLAPTTPHSRNLTSRSLIEHVRCSETIPLSDATGNPVGRLAPECIGRLARTTAEKVTSSDLSAMLDPMAIGGKAYEPDKIKAAVKLALTETAEEMRTSGALVSREGATRYTTDTHSERGRRPKMEDRHIVVEDLNAFLGLEGLPAQAFFGVYDGHGGVDAAEHAESQLPGAIAAHADFGANPQAALKGGIEAVDNTFLAKAEQEALTCGATVCTVFVRGDKMYVGWLGDSQAMLCRAGTAVVLMDPHKPERPDEKKRIEDAGGVVVMYGTWRVQGQLSVARAIGDIKLKKYVIGNPDITEHTLDGTEDYMVIACDGLWDVMTHATVLEYVAAWRDRNPGKERGLAHDLADHCLNELSSTDNITVVVVFFHTV